jgi:hypothetical protein
VQSKKTSRQHSPVNAMIDREIKMLVHPQSISSQNSYDWMPEPSPSIRVDKKMNIRYMTGPMSPSAASSRLNKHNDQQICVKKLISNMCSQTKPKKDQAIQCNDAPASDKKQHKSASMQVDQILSRYLTSEFKRKFISDNKAMQ